MKKLSIIGKGTAGALSAAYFSRHTDWEIDWYYDPNIKPVPVGEACATSLPYLLKDCINFKHSDLEKIDGNLKFGIRKIDWNGTGDYYEEFLPPIVAYHFNANKLQDFIEDKLKTKVNIIHKNITSLDNIDGDYILNCMGKTKNEDEYNSIDCLPVNSAYVTQCYWDYPKFQYTISIAKEYGWCFVIPLKNRCAVGYVYNDNYSTLDIIKEDVKEIFKTFNLEPSDTTISLKFKSYFKKNNFDNRIVYNGNASFFLEPLEAFPIGIMTQIITNSYKIWHKNDLSLQKANEIFHKSIEETQTMILMHYFAGSKYNNEFWKFAQDRAKQKLSKSIKMILQDYSKAINNGQSPDQFNNFLQGNFLNTKDDLWYLRLFHLNFNGLGLKDRIKEITS